MHASVTLQYYHSALRATATSLGDKPRAYLIIIFEEHRTAINKFNPGVKLCICLQLLVDSFDGRSVPTANICNPLNQACQSHMQGEAESMSLIS